MPLLLITVLMFWMQRRVLGRKGYAAVTGKGGERRMVRARCWRWVLLAHALTVCALSVLLPMSVLLQAAFAKAWGRGFQLDNLTLHNFHYLLFEQTQAQNTIINTFVYAGVTAFAAISLALAIAYVVNRKLLPWSQRACVSLRGAVRDPGNRACDRFLCRLRAAAPCALRHRARSWFSLYDALPPHRLYVERRQHAQHQSGNGGGGAHSGWRPAVGDPEGLGAALEEKLGRRLDPGVHPGRA